MKKYILALTVTLLLSGGAIATGLIATDHNHNNESTISHSGGTNSSGCHNDRIRGGYHCH